MVYGKLGGKWGPRAGQSTQFRNPLIRVGLPGSNLQALPLRDEMLPLPLAGGDHLPHQNSCFPPRKKSGATRCSSSWDRRRQQELPFERRALNSLNQTHTPQETASVSPPRPQVSTALRDRGKEPLKETADIITSKIPTSLRLTLPPSRHC